MVIMNGVDAGGDYTCSNRGQSIVDYIIFDHRIASRVYSTHLLQQEHNLQYVPKSMRVWKEEVANVSDHKLITCDLVSQGEEAQKTEKEIIESESNGRLRGW